MPKSNLSFIEAHEEGEALALLGQQMQELTGKEGCPRPCGYYVCAKVYIRDTIGSLKQLVASDITKTADKYNSVAALVMAVGPDAYKGERFADSGPWCKPGDWVMLPRYEGFPFMFRGVAMQMLPDDKVLAIIEDPEDVIASHVADKI